MWSQLSLYLSSGQGMVTAVSVLWTRRGQNCHYSVDKTGSQLSVSVFRNKAWSKLSKSSGQDVVPAVSVRWTRRGHICLWLCPVDKTWSHLCPCSKDKLWSQLSLPVGHDEVTTDSASEQNMVTALSVQWTKCGHFCLCPVNRTWSQLSGSVSSGQDAVTTVSVQ